MAEGPDQNQKPRAPWRDHWREIIFEAETPAGRRFDLCLLWMILLSTAAVMAESVPEIRARWLPELTVVEWGFTILFTIEYIARLLVIRRPLAYARSFYGVVDVLAFLPSYLELFIPGMHALIVIRMLRLLRVFRILKMTRHVNGAELLLRALYGSRAKITVFFFFLISITVIAGTLMYLIEGEKSGYTSIPTSIYWAVVTITTLGFGDITPVTPLGKLVTSILSLTGYAILAVPTGIVSSEMVKLSGDDTSDACPNCGVHGHLPDARYCRRCGGKL